MRVLLASSMGGMGHLVPVLRVAAACRHLGHEITVLVPPALASEAARSGFPVEVGAEPPRAFVDDIWKRIRGTPPEPGLIDRELFADRATAAMLDAARAVRDSFGPDLVVREPCEYSSAVAAHEAGVAQAEVGISLAAIEWRVVSMVAPIIDRYADGVAGAIRAAPYLSPFPAALDPSPWPDTRRFSQALSAAGSLPEGWPGDDRPLVYITFGSVTGYLPEAAGIYRTALDAVAELPTRVLLTVGHSIDVSDLSPVPANTRVAQWVPQTDIFPKAAVVVCHGGSGTTFGALEAGVPVVVCPLFADQSENGHVVQAAGAGLLVRGREVAAGGLQSLGQGDVAPLREAIAEVLVNPEYRRAAESISAEMRAVPAIDRVVDDLIATA